MTNTTEIFIRHARPDDLPEIQALFVETIAEICNADYSQDQMRVWTSSVEDKQRWITKLNTQFFIVALSGNQITGYASLEKNDYLDLLYIHKNFQRQGIATRLYSEIETESVKNGSATLTADVSITARPFFEKQGFKIMQTKTNRIEGVDIINHKMIKDLQPDLKY